GASAPADRARQRPAPGRLDGGAGIAGASPAPGARVIAGGLSHRDNGAGQAMERDAQEELALARRHLPLLDTVITFSPLLGLLGTVTSASRRRSPPRPASPAPAGLHGAGDVGAASPAAREARPLRRHTRP